MKRNILYGILFLAAINLYGQETVNQIELLGKGVVGVEEATIAIPDWQNIDYIIAEAVYVCGEAPGYVEFISGSEQKTISPRLIPCGGGSQAGLITSVYRTRFDKPTPEITLDILENSNQFHSFSLFVHRKGGNVQSIQAGELVHVYKNEKIPQLTEIHVSPSAQSRVIKLKFGIIELEDDDLVAVFTFESNGEILGTEIRSWFKNDEIDPYFVQEVLFEEVPGKVDKVSMSLFSTQDKGDSFIAGVVLADLFENSRELLTSAVK